ncbi:MAG: glycosyltransferase family 4 protein [Moraxellaceae bacterium]
MRITFVLPGGAHNPSGGFKIVYEYANHLSRAGHKVTLIHPAYVGAAIERHPVASLRRAMSRYLSRLVTQRWKPSRWFALEKSVSIRWIPLIHPAFIPDADAIFSTLWLTAEQVSRLPESKGKQLYLVQGIEIWGGADDRVIRTWKLPMRKIAISRWIQGELKDAGAESTYIPNGLDFKKFGCDTAMTERDHARIAMLYSALPIKGSREGIAALIAAKNENPAISAEFFGVPSRPHDLPDWITYHQTPSQTELRAIYNRCSIFIAPSLSEGWGLTASEAMQCGAAVIATRIGGHEEFCIDMKSAVLCEPGNSEAIKDAIIRLVNNTELRKTLSLGGQELISRFTWQSSVEKLMAALNER